GVHRMRSARSIVGLVALVSVLSACAYYSGAVDAEQHGTTPWWCTSTGEIPVTSGPAVGSVDYYAGTHKAPLSSTQCKTVSLQLDLARSYALKWPTAGAAVAAGWRMA